ncbi:hypothetical protein SADUNF_Sadunf08G0012900 [Salix dunnii]|uniref:Rapid ALkalinization Factor n=1 Tax=Salix dunnii TaxID=1413687 RepID=A0A835JUR2_9ROSI|nr:hypothetical protein SADUNF_Sadunf08G0012900 [Salix dunnii]
MGFCKRIPFVIVKAMLLLFLIFLSTAETGAFARTMRPATSGANTVYDPNSYSPASSSRPNCKTYIPGDCGIEAMLLLFLIFLSTAETGAFARTMKPATSGANTVYDPNSNRPVSPSGPNCKTYIPGGCGRRNYELPNPHGGGGFSN